MEGLTGKEQLNLPPFFKRKGAAEFAGVSLPTLDKWIRKEGFPYIKVGNRYIIPSDRFKEWLESHIGGEV